MATTWSATRGSIRGDLWRTSSGIPDDVCNRAIHQTLLNIENERKWLWLENLIVSVPIVGTAEFLILPGDCAALQSLSYQRQAGTTFDILKRNDIAVVRMERSTLSPAGYPGAYALIDGKAYLDRDAQDGSIFHLVYTARTPEDLDAAIAIGDDNKTLSRERSAVIAGAAAHIATTFLRNSAEYGRQMTAYEAMIERMHNTENDARTDSFGPSIQPDTSYHDATCRGQGRYA